MAFSYIITSNGIIHIAV